MSVNLTVVGCSPAWPNPGGAQSGYLLDGPGRLLLDCGPGVLAKLREQEPWPTVDAIAITHWHLDHWGDLVPWVWGGTLGPGVDVKKPELWVPPEGSEMLAAIGGRLGQQQMFEEAFNLHEYADGETFEAAGFAAPSVLAAGGGAAGAVPGARPAARRARLGLARAVGAGRPLPPRVRAGRRRLGPLGDPRRWGPADPQSGPGCGRRVTGPGARGRGRRPARATRPRGARPGPGPRRRDRRG